MSFSSSLRYSRQMRLLEVGERGQEAFARTSVLCVGAGGLGSAVLPYLAGAGIGRIGVVDDDTVAVDNLHRQVLYRESDVGMEKASRACQTLESLNTTVRWEPYVTRLTAQNAPRLIEDFDIIVDGSDSFTTQFLLNDVCACLGKPLVYGAILGFSAQVSVFWKDKGPCYRCLYPAPPSLEVGTCASHGVLGPLCAIAGGVQALEVLKLALGDHVAATHGLKTLLGQVWTFDGNGLKTHILTLKKDPSCPICHSSSRDESPLLPTYQEFTPQEAAKLLDQAFFVDVREPWELERLGKINGAHPLPLNQLLEDPSVLDFLPHNQMIILYCQHGVRSRLAADFLIAQGFFNIAHIKGGFSVWNDLTHVEK